MEALSQARKEVSAAAHQRQETVWPPRPMADDWVNKPGNRHTVKKITDKSGTTDHCAGGNSRAGIGKGKLEEPECQKSHTGRLVRCRHIFQKEPVITYQAITVAEHERKTKSIEQQAAETGINNTFHQHINCLA